jgi:HNH endonuclease
MPSVVEYRSAADRNLRQVYPEPNSGCWLWCGSMSKAGYGMLAVPTKERRHPPATTAHRVFYIAAVGQIPFGLTIDHLCRVKLCVNPDHMEAVTSAENVRRAHKGVRVPEEEKALACKRGHRYTPESTKFHPDGRRECMTCSRPRKIEWQRRNRAKKSSSRSAPSSGGSASSSSGPPTKPNNTGTPGRCRRGRAPLALVRDVHVHRDDTE